eukprot:TRINITY_DN5503_c0_g1_i1.p1 TRINITY_DN5503_c0_g1~~TRINITY_DN5503_c0_g1_i1.p1  ORF type:complete len:714 (+),score=174.81 TRINITY_DN5503_c0_g1_i1:166-2307(+)
MYVYKIIFDPPIERVAYPHLEGMIVDAFFMYVKDSVEVPSFMVTRRSKTSLVRVCLVAEMDFSSDQIRLLKNFREFLLQKCRRKPMESFDGNRYTDLLFAPSLISNDEPPGFESSSQWHHANIDCVTRLTMTHDMRGFMLRALGLDESITFPVLDEVQKEILREQFSNRILLSNYNPVSYLVQGFDFDIHPLSMMTLRNNVQKTYMEYYSNKGITIADMSQPLIIHGGSNQRRGKNVKTSELPMEDNPRPPCNADPIQPNTASRGSIDGHRIILIPELCSITGITCEIYRYSFFLPFVWFHIQTYIHLNLFQAQCAIPFADARLLKQAFTHPSYSNEHEGSLTHYQRLEFIGDSILDFMITAKLYFIFPHVDEGRLSFLKTSLVNNEFLTSLGRSLGISEGIIYSENQHFQSEKVIADVFEALIGVLYLCGDLDLVEEMFTLALFSGSADNLLRDYWRSDSEIQYLTESDPILSLYAQVEEKIGIVFHNRNLLVQAFTHPSTWGKDQKIFGHYQRMELLGDSVLEFLVSVWLFEKYPTASEGQMSMCRAHIVSNQNLHRIIEGLDLLKYLRHHSSFLTFDGPRLMKVAADLFESLLGAIYLDQGLDACSRFVQECVIESSEFSPETIVLDPKSLLQHLMQCEGRDVPLYAIVKTTETIYGPIFQVNAVVEGEVMGMGEAETQKQAERLSAEEAIRRYLLVDHYFVAKTDTDII